MVCRHATACFGIKNIVYHNNFEKIGLEFEFITLEQTFSAKT